MKGKVLVLVLTVCLFVGLSISNALAVNNVQYLGKTTWTLTVSESSFTPAGTQLTVTGGLSKVGDEFYLFQGYITAGVPPIIISGSGAMIGSNLMLTLAFSQDHSGSGSPPWYDTGVMQVNLEKSTLSGSFFMAQNDISVTSPTKTMVQGYTIGTLTCTGGPIPLSAAIVAPQLLLLQ